LPDLLDQLRVTADEFWRQMVVKEPHHRRAAGADRVGIAGPHRSVRVEDTDDGRLLTREGLDGIGANDLRHEIDHHDLDPIDLRRRSPPAWLLDANARQA